MSRVEEFHKESQLEFRKLEQMVTECDVYDPTQATDVVLAAARVASERFFASRFGFFGIGPYSIVYVNMGPATLWARDEFRRVLDSDGVDELGAAVWPLDDPYTWAVLLDDPDGYRV